MSKPTSKCQVFGIKMKTGFGFNEVNRVVYVCFSTQGAAKMLGDFKNRVKNTQDADSAKLKSLKIDVSKLDITLLTNTTVGEAPEKVNYFIKKYDTLENGWNSVLR